MNSKDTSIQQKFLSDSWSVSPLPSCYIFPRVFLIFCTSVLKHQPLVDPQNWYQYYVLDWLMLTFYPQLVTLIKVNWACSSLKIIQSTLTSKSAFPSVNIVFLHLDYFKSVQQWILWQSECKPSSPNTHPLFLSCMLCVYHSVSDWRLLSSHQERAKLFRQTRPSSFLFFSLRFISLSHFPTFHPLL